jgi:hypothetical protein
MNANIDWIVTVSRYDTVALFYGNLDSLMSHYFYLSSKINQDVDYYYL